MRIAFLLDSLAVGGAQMLCLSLCRVSRSHGLDLLLVATGSGELEQEFRTSGVEMLSFQRKMPVDIKIVIELRRILLSRQIQLVHSHQAVEALHAYLATRGIHVRCVQSHHGYSPNNRLDNAVNRFLVPRMDANIAVSNAFLQRLDSEAHLDTTRKFCVVHNGVDPTIFSSIENHSGLERWQLGRPVLGMIGNFFDIKDQMTICRALPRVFHRLPDAHFVFVGKPSPMHPHLYQNCVEYCRSRNLLHRVHFLGVRRDVSAILHELDLFVMSTNTDTFGIAVVESMLAGVPVLASDIPPMREVSNDGEFAVLFRAGDSDGLAGEIVRLADNIHERQRLIIGAKEWATKNFSIDAHARRLVDVYTHVLAGRSFDAKPICMKDLDC